MATSRAEALTEFDRYAHQAADLLSYRFWGDQERLIALARERLIAGFDLYPDGPMFELTADALSAEADEENADAIVYLARRQALLRRNERNA
jgi:hypothetical protein